MANHDRDGLKKAAITLLKGIGGIGAIAVGGIVAGGVRSSASKKNDSNKEAKRRQLQARISDIDRELNDFTSVDKFFRKDEFDRLQMERTELREELDNI